jgi:ribonuclease Z
MMTHLEQAFQFDVHIRRDVGEKLPAQGVAVVAKDIEQGVVYESRGIKVTAFAVDHGLVKPALGYRVDFKGHSVVLSGDTRFSENLIHFSEGTDVLIHEVMDTDAFHLKNPSTSPERAQRVASHHDSRTGRHRLHPGKAKTCGVFAHRAR